MIIKIRKMLKNMCQNFAGIIGDRFNYFLIRGNLNPNNRYNHHVFMKNNWSVSVDFVRNTTLELLSLEIKEGKVNGSVAEVGVYQGDFSSLINIHFPSRKLYLFDTFEGFDERDAAFDREKGYSEYQHDFKSTNESIALEKMVAPKNVLVKKGWFPESAQGCEEIFFCFVSLDADLFEPIYQGLLWFYPRLTPGGYIMIHDYNNTTYGGAKEAVRKFVKEYGLVYMPIPDTGGTVVIGKPVIEPENV